MYPHLPQDPDPYSGSACVIASSVGPYRVLDKLGSGGMGEVYLAEDTRLGRKVALKTIAGTVNRDGRDRLRHEARAVAALNHQNIAAIYDVVEDESGMYIVMEFVDGATLAERLRYGPMVAEEALEIGSQVLEALDHAHAHGVVHHDLKPANVSIASGRKVKILDFGIARLHPKTVNPLTTDTTGVGRVFGTPGYCAPEQLLGAVGDRRSDLYSVGVLLFELIAGRPPFDTSDVLGGSAASIGEPPSLAGVAPHVPPALDALVARAMAPDPARRFQSASEMLAAVRRVTPVVWDHPTVEADVPRIPPLAAKRPRWVPRLSVGATTLVLVALAGMPLAEYWQKAPRAGELLLRPTVAVLPLTNHTGDPANDHLGPGIAETISTTLARQPDVVVISRSEIGKAAAGADPRQIARNLGVKFLVQGDLQKVRDALQLNLSLVQPDGSLVWGGTYQAAMADLFGLQERAAGGIATALQVNAFKLPSAQQTVSREALNDYYQGREMLDHRDVPGNLARSIEAFERVVAEAPNYAPAHAALGEAYWEQYRVTLDPSWTTRAIKEATSAIQLGPDDAHARYSLAVIYRGSGRLDEAEEELRRATARQPNHPDAPRLLGNLLADRGRIDDAVKAFDKAIALRPQFGGTFRDLGTALLRAGRYDAAEEALKKATVLDPDTPNAFQALGTLYHTLGRRDEAIVLYREAIKRAPAPEAYANLGAAFYEQRRFAEAAEAYEHALRLSDSSPIRHRSLADVYVQLGRDREARAHYERAIELTRVMLAVNPRDAANLSRLAVYEAKLGRFADASSHIDDAMAIRPDDGGVLFRSGVVLSLHRQYDAAMQALRAAVAAGYSVATIRQEDDLAPLRAREDFNALVAAK